MIANENNENLYTPYECAAVVNTWLKQLEVAKELAPQMFYNYVSKGYIVSEVHNEKKFVSAENLAEWFKGYHNKNILGNKVSKEIEVPENPISV
jgi:hypothetical protein